MCVTPAAPHCRCLRQLPAVSTILIASRPRAATVLAVLDPALGDGVWEFRYDTRVCLHVTMIKKMAPGIWSSDSFPTLTADTLHAPEVCEQRIRWAGSPYAGVELPPSPRRRQREHPTS